MKRQKYHFLTIRQTSTGRQLVLLPGQLLGEKLLTAGILVRDTKGNSLLKKAKKNAGIDDILFTSTLKYRNGYCTATDIHNLNDIDDIMMSDAIDEFDKFKNANSDEYQKQGSAQTDENH